MGLEEIPLVGLASPRSSSGRRRPEPSASTSGSRSASRMRSVLRRPGPRPSVASLDPECSATATARSASSSHTRRQNPPGRRERHSDRKPRPAELRSEQARDALASPRSALRASHRVVHPARSVLHVQKLRCLSEMCRQRVVGLVLRVMRMKAALRTLHALARTNDGRVEIDRHSRQGASHPHLESEIAKQITEPSWVARLKSFRQREKVRPDGSRLRPAKQWKSGSRRSGSRYASRDTPTSSRPTVIRDIRNEP